MTSKRAVAAELAAKRAIANRERAARERADISDIAEFVTQLAREEEVAGWFSGQVRRLEEDAARRRERCRLAAGRALQAIAGRGGSVKEIAAVTGLSAAVVSDYLAAARTVDNGQPPR